MVPLCAYLPLIFLFFVLGGATNEEELGATNEEELGCEGSSSDSMGAGVELLPLWGLTPPGGVISRNFPLLADLCLDFSK